MAKRNPPPRTPDGRYIVVDGTLWRATRPDLSEEDAAALRKDLGKARSDVRRARLAGDGAMIKDARRRVQAAKVGLGERGPVWWDDGAKDYNRHKAKNTPYAAWWADLQAAGGRKAEGEDGPQTTTDADEGETRRGRAAPA